jgi:alkylation response protein AidB-like acyl-CoA dehydrogenase
VKRDIYETEHQAFRETVQQFLERNAWPYVDDWARDKAIPRTFWLEAGKQGLLALEIPEEYGGLAAGDYRFMAVVNEEFNKVNAALGSAWGIHADITAPYIVSLGSEEQKRRWLPAAATGDLLLAIGMTEPSGGSDLAALRTTAVRDGDAWVVNGSKTFITNGYSADLVIAAVRTSPEKKARGITLFAIPSDTPGFSRGRKLDKIGQPEADTAELFFDNVRLGDDHVLGEVDGGFIYMMQKLPQERLSASISNIAHARQILWETLQYTQERSAFGQPIGKFQNSKFLLAEMFTQIEVSEAFLDRCVRAHDAGELTPVDAAKAKWWTSQIQNEVLDNCVQLHGGYGFMTEYRVARAWRDARVTKIWAGSNEIMKELIGRDLGL